MSAEKHEAGLYCRQNNKDKADGNFCTRVSLTHGSRPQSRSRAVTGPTMDTKPQGAVRRDSVQSFEPQKLDHPAWSTIHRPDAEPVGDISSLKKSQVDMLTDRAKKKRRGTSP